MNINERRTTLYSELSRALRSGAVKISSRISSHPLKGVESRASSSLAMAERTGLPIQKTFPYSIDRRQAKP